MLVVLTGNKYDISVNLQHVIKITACATFTGDCIFDPQKRCIPLLHLSYKLSNRGLIGASSHQ